MHCRSTNTHCGVVRSSAASPGRRAPNVGANLHASRVGRVRGTFMAFHCVFTGACSMVGCGRLIGYVSVGKLVSDIFRHGALLSTVVHASP